MHINDALIDFANGAPIAQGQIQIIGSGPAATPMTPHDYVRLDFLSAGLLINPVAELKKLHNGFCAMHHGARALSSAIEGRVAMRHYSSWIAGLAYEAPDGTNRAVYCAGLRKGDVLDLVPEPHNKFDPNAVALYHQGHHVGYVPGKHHWVSASLGEGDTLECKVTAVARDGSGGADRLALKITVTADGDKVGDEDDLEDASSPKFTYREPSVVSQFEIQSGPKFRSHSGQLSRAELSA